MTYLVENIPIGDICSLVAGLFFDILGDLFNDLRSFFYRSCSIAILVGLKDIPIVEN